MSILGRLFSSSLVLIVASADGAQTAPPPKMMHIQKARLSWNEASSTESPLDTSRIDLNQKPKALQLTQSGTSQHFTPTSPLKGTADAYRTFVKSFEAAVHIPLNTFINPINGDICRLKYQFALSSEFFFQYTIDFKDVQLNSIEWVHAAWTGKGSAYDWPGIRLKAAPGKQFPAQGLVFGTLHPTDSIKLVFGIVEISDASFRSFVSLARGCGSK